MVKKRSISKQIIRGLVVGVALWIPITPPAYFLLIHRNRPTNLARLYYKFIDKFEGSVFERLIENDFNIDYEGTLEEDTLFGLYSDLLRIKRANPELLNHVKKITIIPEKIVQSEFVYPYLDYAGLADYSGNIELPEGYSLDNLAHELTHTKYFKTSKEYRKKFSELFDWNQEVNRTKDGTLWKDGGINPKNGFPEPYAAINEHECIATYVEKFYLNENNYSFWRQMKKDFDYEKVLKLLLEENFITTEQYMSAVAEFK